LSVTSSTVGVDLAVARAPGLPAAAVVAASCSAGSVFPLIKYILTTTKKIKPDRLCNVLLFSRPFFLRNFSSANFSPHTHEHRHHDHGRLHDSLENSWLRLCDVFSGSYSDNFAGFGVEGENEAEGGREGKRIGSGVLSFDS
jgi:hypothetical protein